MCGRYTLKSEAEELIEAFELANTPPSPQGDLLADDPDAAPDDSDVLRLPPRYNIAPSQLVPVIANLPGPRRLRLARWGLVPSWARDPRIGYKTINARAETVASKPSFRAAFRRRRCLIPADGFYEWQKGPGGKRPMHIARTDGKPFAFAGLWETWQPKDHHQALPLHTCTVITTEPNALMAPIHDRMPVILPQESWRLWLTSGDPGRQQLEALLTPCPVEGWTTWEVSTLVNSPKNDTPACVAPVQRLL